jgi:hypothetical protein
MGLFCNKRCQDRKDRKLELKFNYKMQKNDNKTSVKHNRIDSKENRHITAYSMGIDPNAAMWQGIADTTKAVGDAVVGSIGAGALKKAVTGNPLSKGAADSDVSDVSDDRGGMGGFMSNLKIFIPIVAVLLAFFLNNFFKRS